MIYFVAYDIADRKRLAKTAKILSNFGIRVQFSFFECEMEKPEMEELKRKLLAVLHENEDSLKIYPLCSDCLRQVSCLGNGDVFVPRSFEIL